MAESLHAGPSGQVRREQSAPANPVKQEQTPHGVVHVPLPLQELGQGVYWEDDTGRVRVMRWRAVAAIDPRLFFLILNKEEARLRIAKKRVAERSREDGEIIWKN